MKNNVLTALVVLVLVALVAQAIFTFYNKTETDSRIEQLNLRKQIIVNTDSLRSVIEERIINKMKAEFKIRDEEISRLKSDLIKTRKKNAELEKLYRSIPNIDMPDY